MKTTTLLTVVGGLGLFLAGVGIGHTLFREAPDRESVDRVSAPAGLVSHAPAAQAVGIHSPGFTIEGSDSASRLLAAVAIRDYYQRGLAIHQVAQQLDEASVREALEMTAKFNVYARTWVRPRLLSRWIDFNRDAAFAWADQLPKSERDTMLREFYQTLALKMPGEALRFLDQQKATSRPGDRFFFEVFDVWAANDPLAAADAAARLTDSTERDRATQTVLRRLAQQNPAEALLRMAALPEDQRSGAVSSIFGSWAARDPDAAWESANVLKTRGERQNAFGSILNVVAQAGVERALELARGLPADIRVGAISQAIASMYDNPEVSSELILMLPASRQMGQTSSVAHRLAENSTSGALEWVQNLTNGQAREMAIRSIVQSSNLKDPKAALDFLERFPMKERYLRENAFSKWAGKEPEAARAWLNGLPESEEKNSMRTSLVTLDAGKDPLGAIEKASKLEGDAKSNAFQRIASIWSYREPEEAIKWAMGDSAKSNPFLMSTVLRNWAEQNPSETAAWIQKQPAGSTRDNVTAQFATIVVADDPAAALDWANSIADPKQRENAQQRCLERWKRDDQVRMEAWLSANPDVPQSVRDRLQKSTGSSGVGLTEPIPGVR